MKLLHLLAAFAVAVAPVGPLAAVTSTGPAASAQVVAQEQVPAEEFPEEAEEEGEQPWTSRYLAPTVAAMAALVLVAVAILYGFRVRGRYRVVR